MNYNDIKELISIIDNSKLTNFELSMDNVNVKMSKTGAEFTPVENSNMPQQTVVSHPVQPTTPVMPVVEEETIAEEKVEVSGDIVKSPIVGTFYASTSPGKPPIISRGDKVSKGDVLCIVEAMKVMNEITSDFDGEILDILVENGQFVEFGEPLFVIG